jgi:hypothetical protein
MAAAIATACAAVSEPSVPTAILEIIALRRLTATAPRE